MSRPSHPIDRPEEPSPEFLRARSVAGKTLDAEFRRQRGKVEESRDYKWIKAELTWPSFDHLTFGYRNQVFSVLVEMVQGNRSLLPRRDIDRCVHAAHENNLVPCAFRVDAATGRPLAAGWNLASLVDGKPVIPDQLATDAPVPMSEWELRNFAIQVVRAHIEEKLNARILSYCDVIGIDPQLWFEDAGGNRQWVIVRHCRAISGDERSQFVGIANSNPQLRPFDGYFAAVSAASSAPILLDLNGEIVPPSRRFDGTAPLYRGDGFYVKFDGIERIYVC